MKPSEWKKLIDVLNEHNQLQKEHNDLIRETNRNLEFIAEQLGNIWSGMP